MVFFVFEIALLALFVVLVTVKGNPAPNRYGPYQAVERFIL